jgi:hypothetical protein
LPRKLPHTYKFKKEKNSSKKFDVVRGDLVIFDDNVAFSSHGPFLFPPLFSLDHFDISNPNFDDDVVISLDDCFSTPNTNLPNVP